MTAETFFQLFNLCFHRLSAVDHTDTYARNKLTELAQLIPYLDSKLPCRSKNQSLDCFFFRVELFNHWNTERTGLSRAGLGAAQHIPARDAGRDGFFLDHGGFRVSVVCQRG